MAAYGAVEGACLHADGRQMVHSMGLHASTWQAHGALQALHDV